MKELLNPFLALIIFIISFGVAYVLARLLKLKTLKRKYDEIQGLRGFWL